jgi:hypothetical protein
MIATGPGLSCASGSSSVPRTPEPRRTCDARMARPHRVATSQARVRRARSSTFPATRALEEIAGGDPFTRYQGERSRQELRLFRRAEIDGLVAPPALARQVAERVRVGPLADRPEPARAHKQRLQRHAPDPLRFLELVHLPAPHIGGMSPGTDSGATAISAPKPMIASASGTSIAALGGRSF